MVLADSFYYQPVRIDTINTRVNADLFAKEGDANGRGMVVQITENGIIKDTTGITLRLQWSHISVGVSGFTEFEVVDATKGLYKLIYPTSMLHRGIVEAFIRITDNGILSGTRNLLITVERMVGSDETIEAADDFSALQTALTKLTIWEATISGKVDTWEADMEATKKLYIDTLSAAEAAYPQELLSLQGQLAETVRGETGKTVQTLAGVIRNSGTGWFFIDDAGHNRINMSTVVVQTGSIRVGHTASAIKVGSLIAAADETFAKEGMICGASVGNTFSLIDLYFPLNVQVKGDGTFVAKNYFTPSLSLVFSGDNSQFTLTHPSCDAFDTPSLVCPISAGSSGEFAVSYSGTSVTVERRGDLAGYIYYDVATTSFKYVGDNVNNLTFDFTNGILKVTHSAVVGNLYGILVSERDGGYKPKVVSPLTSSFQLKFFDGAGTLITTPDANCKAYFARIGAKYKMPFKTGERVLINRGHCKADANNVVNASANVWIYGAMQL